jgi:hypothetical protein
VIPDTDLQDQPVFIQPVVRHNNSDDQQAIIDIFLGHNG